MGRHPVVRFTALCSALILGALLVVWGIAGFSTLGMSSHGVVAMILGAVFSVLLASALMGLLFHSEHSRRDGDPPGW